MEFIQRAYVIATAGILLTVFCENVRAGVSAFNDDKDLAYYFSGSFRPETFFGRNISLLNNRNNSDRVIFSRHILDLNLDVLYGQKNYGRNVAEIFFTTRSKAVWGDPKSIAQTTESPVKIANTVFGGHKHFIPRQIFWIREGWLSFSIKELLGLSTANEHTFTVGSFRFELGRGIALGSAFAVGPELLGFYSDSAVDQYAFGAKFSGDLVDKKLSYDLYAAILQNKSGSLGDTGEKIRGQEFGRLACPERGFGRVNVLYAGRLNWTVFNNNAGLLNFEPYWLFNNDSEQRVEFLADAKSELGTFGLACEYSGDRGGIGFDCAVNLGRQHVRGWDRNSIVVENREGLLAEVNTKVLSADPAVVNNPSKVLYDTNTSAGKKVQSLVNSATQSEECNGQKIGTVDNVDIFNATDRFRNNYTNKYDGWMFITDAAYFIHDRDIQFAAMAGTASGDDNPNEETVDGNFKGFVGLQEVYSGKRVRSAFLLGGAGKVRRPLALPKVGKPNSKFARVVSGFTNIVVAGGSVRWEPQHHEKKFIFHPNILAYWQNKSTNKFGPVEDKDGNVSFQELDTKASKFLGVELNAFLDYYWMNDLKFFTVVSIFIPGSHYDDIKGKPITAEQAKILDRRDRTGFNDDGLPNVGNDIAYTFNIGLEFKF